MLDISVEQAEHAPEILRVYGLNNHFAGFGKLKDDLDGRPMVMKLAQVADELDLLLLKKLGVFYLPAEWT